MNTTKEVNKQHLEEIKTLIKGEYEKFHEQLLCQTCEQVFDRAQEILIKTAITDEICCDFEETFDNMRDPEDQYCLVETLWWHLQEGNWDNMLHGLYLEYLQYQDMIFDPEILADFMCDQYCDWQMIWRFEGEPYE